MLPCLHRIYSFAIQQVFFHESVKDFFAEEFTDFIGVESVWEFMESAGVIDSAGESHRVRMRMPRACQERKELHQMAQPEHQ